MSIFDYPIFLCFIIFLIWFAVKRTQLNKLEKKKDDEFWQRESDANFTRKKNLDLVKYIEIPLDTFPIGTLTDSEAAILEASLKDLSGKRILNLTGKTTTDLKFEYGAANLPYVTEYDENYVTLLKTLDRYAHLLYSVNNVEGAKTVLEFSVSTGCDIFTSYDLLSDIYIRIGNAEKINNLIDVARTLDSLSKNKIINVLSEKLTVKE